MSSWELKKDKFTYVLRYYLPCKPQYEEAISLKRQEELIGFCLKNKVSAVMLYVDLNPYWYYMPDTLEHNSYYVSLIKPFAEKLRDKGISYQINYQNLFGSWDGNFDHRDLMGWECYVDEFGRASKGCACMIGENFRKLAGAKLKAWAETMPDAIWIDDDIRLHNHRTGIYDLWEGKSSAEGLDFGCFCNQHIAKFNALYKTAYTREEIVDAILKKGNHPQLGEDYRVFLNDTLSDTAKWIEENIHSVSPNTRVGLMTSKPDVHTLEGRNWATLLDNLSGKYKPLLRPTFGPYSESVPRDFAESYAIVKQMEAHIEEQYKQPYDMCPEIENTRFTMYSKSLAATAYQIDLSAFFGFGGVTLSIFDLEGVILEEQGEFGKLLVEHKDFCDKLTQMDIHDYQARGVAFITSPDRYCNVDGKAGRISEMLPKRKLDQLISTLGIAYTYITPEKIEEAEIVALDRYTVKLLTDDELLCALSKAVFLDSGAAMEVVRRGFGAHIGINVGEKISCVAASEWIHAIKRGDGSVVIVPSRIPGNAWRELQLKGAETLSSLVTPGGEFYPGFCSYVNELGGKVAVYAAENDFGDGFATDYRVQLLKDIIDFLCPDTVRAEFKSFGSILVRSKDNKQMIFVTNLAADTISKISIRLPAIPKNAEIFSHKKGTGSLQIQRNSIRIEEKLGIYDSVAIALEY